jgi:hypothetical protein
MMNGNAAHTISPDAKKVASVALKTFFNIMDAWGVKNDKQMTLLGRPSDSTFFNWKKGKVSALPHDTLERISYVLGIYKALGVLFPTRKQADAWVNKDNQAFEGASALEYMAKGSMVQLIHIRRYLDAQRG